MVCLVLPLKKIMGPNLHTSVGINMYEAIVLDDVSFNHASESFKNIFKLFIGGTFGNVADK